MISYTLQIFKKNAAGSFVAVPDMSFPTPRAAIDYVGNLARLSPNAYFIKPSGVFHVEDGGGEATRYSFGWSRDEIGYAEKWNLKIVDRD